MSESAETYEYFSLAQPGRIVRRHRAEDRFDVLTHNGWVVASPLLARRTRDKEARDPAEIERRCRQRLNPTDIAKRTAPEARLRRIARRAWSLLVPPLKYGAPTDFDTTGLQPAGIAAYFEELPDGLADPVLADLVEQAKDGYERQTERAKGLEQRAAAYQGGASISGTLVLVGSGFATATETYHPSPFFVLGVAVVSLLLLFSGFRAHQASVHTFTWSRPHTKRKLLARAREPHLSDARRKLLATYLLAQDRGQLIADWKLARLRHASLAFAYAVLVATVITGGFIIAQVW